jgi:hypothetical protein
LNQTYLQDAVRICAVEDAVVLQFSNDAQVTSFLNLMKGGESKQVKNQIDHSKINKYL